MQLQISSPHIDREVIRTDRDEYATIVLGGRSQQVCFPESFNIHLQRTNHNSKFMSSEATE